MVNIENQILEQIKKSNSIVITSHKSPDGDSIGSTLALAQFCKKINKKVFVCHPDPAPKFLRWVDGVNEILTFEENKEQVIKLFGEADLIFALDYNDSARLGNEMAEIWNQSIAFKILIDHHPNPSEFVNISWSDTTICSTSQMIFEFIENSDSLELLDEKIGTSIYLGIMTDTGSFRFNSVKPKTHLILSKLLEKGVKHDLIHENVFDDNTLDKLKLRGYAISQKLVLLDHYKTAYISLSKEELDRFHHEKGDTEGLVNIALSIQGIKIAAFFSENEKEIKISFRSKGSDYPVNKLASENFSGGGHANAAGGKYNGSLEEAIQKFISILPKYV